MLERLRATGAASQAELADQLGLTSMAISRITRELIAAGLVERGPKRARHSFPGRRSIDISLSPTGAYVLGVSVSAYDRVLVLVNLRGEVVLQEAVGSSTDLADSDRFLADVGVTAERLMGESGVERPRVLGLGVAAAGTVDNRLGIVHAAPYIGWEEVDVAATLSARLGLPVAAENINNAITLGETRCGCCINRRNVLMVRVATGIGGSFLCEGRLVHGATFAGGQFGHVAAPGADRPCACGRRGCLNTVAAGWAVLADLGMAAPPAAAPHDVAANARKLDEAMARAAGGDVQVARAFRSAGSVLAEALKDWCVALDPELVLLAGPVTRNPDYLEGVRESWSREHRGGKGALPPLVCSSMEPHVAAAHLALSTFVFSPGLNLKPLLQGGPNRARVAPGVKA